MWKKNANYQANVGKRKLDKTDPINDQLLAWWTFDNTSVAGTRLNDQSGNANTGTLTGSPSIGTGVIQSGQGLVTNGGGMKVTTSLLVPTTNFTIAGWVTTATSSGNNRPFGNANTTSGTDGTSVIFGLNANKVYFVARQGSNVGTFDLEVTPSGGITGTHHVAWTIGPGGLRAYWDGVSIGVNTNTLLITSVQTMSLGADGNQSGSSFTGTTDDVRIWKRVLSAAEIQRLYNDQTGSLGLKPIKPLAPKLPSLLLDGVRAVAGFGRPTISSIPDPSPFPNNLNRNALRRNTIFSEDSTDDDDQVRKSIFQFRQRLRQPYTIGISAVAVSKAIQFDVLAPPDTSVDVAKLLQFDVLAPPDTAVDVAKFVQYAVVELLPSINLPAAIRHLQISNAWEDFDTEEAASRNRLIEFRRTAVPSGTSVSLTGVAGTSGIGALIGAGQAILTGVAGSGAAGTLRASIAFTPSGVSASSGIGTVTVDVRLTVPVTGVSATAGIGSPSLRITANVTLTGVAGTSHVGRLGTQTGDFRIAGVGATAGIGSPFVIVTTNQTNVTLTGVAVAALVGSLAKAMRVALTGVASHAHVGTPSVLVFSQGFEMTELECVTIPSIPTDQLVSLRWSDDKGVSYSNAIMQTMGDTGEYFINLQWRRLGMARDRVFELSWSSDQATALTGAFINFTEAGT